MQATKVVGASALLVALLAGANAASARTFGPESLIIPMDLAYQDQGLMQAYGLLFQLLRQGVEVQWVIDPDKTWHALPCDEPGNECAWDCAEEGSGEKCPYPTASPDFFAAATVVWDDRGAAAGATISSHGYRGGPFVIDPEFHDQALAIIDIWNDPAQWAANPWAARTVAGVVSVHQATAAFDAEVSRELLAAPTIAVFSDGNEDIATGYLRAAGIAQSNGAEFPAARCGANNCGPGTANPDMLTVPSVMGDLGTCDAPIADHGNGALFTDDGVPAYCQIMSMHWNVSDREKVECDGGACPATEAACAGETFTYHGHEVVAEVRAFLQYPVHFFAECQAVNAYENTSPNPAWPYLDDDGRDGHFLTTEGTPPPCPCNEAGFACVVGGCDGVDCCLPTDDRELGAGFLIAPRPDDVTVLHPEVPYNQLDGRFGTVGGSEPAYNLSAYLGTEYKNDREVTFLTGPDGPGQQDVWMTGYVDGDCDIVLDKLAPGRVAGECAKGKVSYLGGHEYSTGTPLSNNESSQGARMFLNALFEADCVTSTGQPVLSLELTPLLVAAQAVPVTTDLTAVFANAGLGAALAAQLNLAIGGAAELTDAVGGTVGADGATWTLGSIAGVPVRPGDPPAAGSHQASATFPAFATYPATVTLTYRVGLSMLTTAQTYMITVASDRDGDGSIDDDDEFPDDAGRCGDSDDDTCDDCSAGTFDPAADGLDTDGNGICDAGEGGAGGDDAGASGGCCDSGTGAGGSMVLALLVLGLGLPRSRRRTVVVR